MDPGRPRPAWNQVPVTGQYADSSMYADQTQPSASTSQPPPPQSYPAGPHRTGPAPGKPAPPASGLHPYAYPQHSTGSYVPPASAPQQYAGHAQPPGMYAHNYHQPGAPGYPPAPASAQMAMPQFPGAGLMGAAMGGQPPASQNPGSLLNPWTMFSSVSQMGHNVQASGQYVQSKVSWFTGGLFQQHFQVDPKYVRSKLLLLLAPFLRRYDYIRTPEQMAAGAHAMKPPRYDLFAPDLYIPLVAMLSYVVMVAATKFMGGAFRPELMYNAFTWAAVGWFVNFLAVYVLCKMMALRAPPPMLDLCAYSGYPFVGYCASMAVGWALGGGLPWHLAWLYFSACTAVFLIRTFKQAIRMDGSAASRTVMYVLLMMGATQFVTAWVMGATVHPSKTHGPHLLSDL